MKRLFWLLIFLIPLPIVLLLSLPWAAFQITWESFNDHDIPEDTLGHAWLRWCRRRAGIKAREYAWEHTWPRGHHPGHPGGYTPRESFPVTDQTTTPTPPCKQPRGGTGKSP